MSWTYLLSLILSHFVLSLHNLQIRLFFVGILSHCDTFLILHENVVCILCQLHILKCIPETFNLGSKHFEPWSDCSLGSALIWVHIVCNIGLQLVLYFSFVVWLYYVVLDLVIILWCEEMFAWLWMCYCCCECICYALVSWIKNSRI